MDETMTMTEPQGGGGSAGTSAGGAAEQSARWTAGNTP